ncbi:MAG TPA: pseudouridine synthase [Gemmatimonadota bacterium]|nr:pseudouridine synthase [Gemmatimonadota bacterium]
MAVRLQRYLAQAGVASRRRCEDLIAAGLVAVNGKVVTAPGTTVDPESDRVTLRGRRVRPRFAELSPGAALGSILHKPRGVLTSRSDPGGRPTVYDLVREPAEGRLVYVGRLDRDTEGLLLFTTDGRLAHRLTHPRWRIERAYEAEVEGALDEKRLFAGARRGIVLEDGRTGPFRARVLASRPHSPRRRRVELVLTEGRKREVRRILGACGVQVERLVRTRFAFLTLAGLTPGESRKLAPREMDRLRRLVGLPPVPGMES